MLGFRNKKGELIKNITEYFSFATYLIEENGTGFSISEVLQTRHCTLDDFRYVKKGIKMESEVEEEFKYLFDRYICLDDPTKFELQKFRNNTQKTIGIFMAKCDKGSLS